MTIIKINFKDYIDSVKQEDKNVVYDYCVLCGKKTNVPEDTPIMNREHYIEGAGQLCENCFKYTQN